MHMEQPQADTPVILDDALNVPLAAGSTVTVLYYDAPVGLVMHNAVLAGLSLSESGRVVLPTDFRRGKSIIAVLEGECRILNALGERVYAQKSVGID